MRPTTLQTSALLVTVFVAPLVASQNNNPDGTCYFPSGTVAHGYYPCDPNAFITQCCPSGWTCFANSLCVITDSRTANSSQAIGTTRRAGCTNALWNNKICGDFCLNVQNDNGTMDACGDNTFCCAGDESSGKCSCKDKRGTVSVPSGPVQTVISLSNGATATPIFNPSSSSFITSSSTASSVGTDTSTPTPDPSPSNKSLGIKVGVPVAIVGAIALIVIAIVLWRCWPNRTSRQSQPMSQQAAYFEPEGAPRYGNNRRL